MTNRLTSVRHSRCVCVVYWQAAAAAGDMYTDARDGITVGLVCRVSNSTWRHDWRV